MQTSITASLLVFVLVIIPNTHIEPASASGHFQENTIDERDFQQHPAILSYDISAVEEQGELHSLVRLTLKDNQTQEPLQFVTYTLKITNLETNVIVIGPDAFHTEDGTIILDIGDTDGQTEIQGSRNDFINAWMNDPATGTIKMRLPLTPDTTYLFEMTIIGVDSIRGFLPQDKSPTFELYFNPSQSTIGQIIIAPEFPYHVAVFLSLVIAVSIFISRTDLPMRLTSAQKS